MPRDLCSEGPRDLGLRMGKGRLWQACERKGGCRARMQRRAGAGRTLAQGSLLPSSTTAGEKAEYSHFPLAVHF